MLTVIVPVFGCKTIDQDLKKIADYLEKLNKPFEIICVVDGKKNAADKTPLLAKKVVSKQISTYYYQENKGKGYAIRFGMARSKGEIVTFIDAGSDLEATGIGFALEIMKLKNADIVIGSKRHPDSKVNYPWQRKVLSLLVQKATRLLFRLNVSDTQTGLKVFKRKVLVKVLPRLLVKRWAFDLEILVVAKRMGFTKIFESPVELNYNFSSNINTKAVRNFINDYLAIFYRTYILRYYDSVKDDRFRGDPELKLKYK